MRKFDLLKLLVGAVMSLIMTNGAYAETYITLKDGKWDSKEVWSTDGKSLCGCSPDLNNTSDVIQIQNSIDLNHTLFLGNASNLSIAKNGALFSNYSIMVAGGKLENDGRIELTDLSVFENGQVDARNGSELIANHRVTITSGKVQLTHSILTLTSGPIHVAQHGVLSLIQNSKVELEYGELNVDGKITVDNNSIVISSSQLYSDDSFLELFARSELK